MDAHIGCSLTPASIWANFEHFWLFFDWDMPFSVSPFFINWLKIPIAPHFVTLHWPTTPYNASMRILAAEVVHDLPGLFLSHLVIKKFYILIPTPGWKAVEKFQFWPFWRLVWCLHQYMSNQLLKPNKVIQVRDFAHILMKHILAQPDSFVTKINNLPANQGWWARERTRTWWFR